MATAIPAGAAGPLDAHFPPAATPDQPAASRISSLDFIRGVAVLGILATNIIGYSQLPGAHRWMTLLGEPDWAEKALWLFNYLFVDGKLRALFAMLFGAGLVLFMDRAKAKGATPLWLQFRRLFWLALFGLAHFFLFFEGDILFHYAVLGMAAMLLVRLPAKLLIAAGLLLYCGDSALDGPALWDWRKFEVEALASPPRSEIRQEYLAENAADRADAVEEGRVLKDGSFAEIVAFRIENRRFALLDSLPFMILDSFSMMLLGAGLYRAGFFAAGALHRDRLLRWGIAGIAVSALASLALGAWLIAEGFPRALNMFVFYGPSQAVRAPMIMGYAAVLVAMSPQWVPTGLGRRLSAAGRMAFTNYVGASIVMAAIFQGWGLGLFGEYHRPGMVFFVFLGWALMLVCSPWWLARFRYGPLEWLWRCLTYWKPFPIRRAANA